MLNNRNQIIALAITVFAATTFQAALHAAPDESRQPTATVWPHAADAKAELPPSITLRAGEDEVARVWLCYDANNLYLRYRVLDASPLQNAGTESKLLFKTGDSVDLQLGLNPDADPKRTTPVEGDIRLLMTRTKDGPIAVIYRYKVAGTQTPERFWSPVSEVLVDRVEQLKDAKIETQLVDGGYQLNATIPWTALAGKEYSPPAGKALRGDVGVLFSDPDGQVTVERIYWSNKNTAVVADVPSEIRLHPDKWAELILIKPKN